MSKYTPGPWDIRKIDSAPSFRGIFAVCSNGGGGSIREEEQANALLIAAAPEMAQMLRKLCYSHGLDGDTEFRNQLMADVRQLLNKAGIE
jgi:hypothetical protein